MAIMNKLYDIFEREKENNPNVTVHYNKFRQSLDYSNDNGVLTVLFNPEKDGERQEGCEEFYFKSSRHDKGLGRLVLKTSGYGSVGVSDEYCIREIPDEFIRIAQRYQFNREEIGVEKNPPKPMISVKANGTTIRAASEIYDHD